MPLSMQCPKITLVVSAWPTRQMGSSFGRCFRSNAQDSKQWMLEWHHLHVIKWRSRGFHSAHVKAWQITDWLIPHLKTQKNWLVNNSGTRPTQTVDVTRLHNPAGWCLPTHTAINSYLKPYRLPTCICHNTQR